MVEVNNDAISRKIRIRSLTDIDYRKENYLVLRWHPFSITIVPLGHSSISSMIHRTRTSNRSNGFDYVRVEDDLVHPWNTIEGK